MAVVLAVFFIPCLHVSTLGSLVTGPVCVNLVIPVILRETRQPVLCTRRFAAFCAAGKLSASLQPVLCVVPVSWERTVPFSLCAFAKILHGSPEAGLRSSLAEVLRVPGTCFKCFCSRNFPD